MQRTDSDRAGLASRLEFGRDGRQEGGPLRDDRKATAKMLSAKGLSTREIAEITGWSHTTIENDLRGKNLPKTGKNLPAPTVAEPTGPSVAEPIAPSLAEPTGPSVATGPSVISFIDPDRARNEERTAEGCLK